MKDEFREIKSVHPVRLGPEDLRELERVLREIFSKGHCSIEFRLVDEGKTVRADSVESLLGKSLPKMCNRLYITARQWTAGGDIDAGVSIDLNFNGVSFQPHADDEGTFSTHKGTVVPVL